MTTLMDINASRPQHFTTKLARTRESIECAGRQLTFPELLSEDLCTAVPAISRQGVRTVVVEGRNVSERTNRDLAAAWFANYSVRGFVSPEWQCHWRDRMPHLTDEASRSLHLASMDTVSGRLLCYMAIKPDPSSTAVADLREDGLRLPLPVEQLFGADVFDSVAHLRSVPARRVREVGRFVKDQLHPGFRSQKMRAPLEIKCAFVRMLCHYLPCDALVGDSHPSGAVAAFDLFHIPYALLVDRKPLPQSGDLLAPYFEAVPVLPFVVMRRDVQAAHARSSQIEAFLNRPDLTRRDLVALHREARDCSRRVES